MDTKITAYNTFITIEVDKFGVTPEGFNIRKSSGRYIEFEKDKHTDKWKPVKFYMNYDPVKKLRYLPRQALEHVIMELKQQGCNPLVLRGKLVEPRPISFNMKDNFETREYQEESIEFLKDKYLPMKLLSLSTGLGKSNIGIKVVHDLQMVAMIIADAMVLDQWKQRFLSVTDLQEEDVFTLQGLPSLKKLFKLNKESGYKPKIIVASIDTVSAYIAGTTEGYNEFMSFSKFCEYFGIGIKIVDEAHLNMFAALMIDLNCKILHNLYLTATPRRSTWKDNNIYNNIYPESIRFDGNYYEKHVNVMQYKYELVLNCNERKFQGFKGYSQHKYDDYLLSNPFYFNEFIDNILGVMIKRHFISRRLPHEKCLIFVNKKNVGDKYAAVLSKKFPDLKVLTKFSDDADDVYQDADIIVSTHGSSGTAKDIAGLITTINTTSYQSDVVAEQQLGRTRKIKDRDVYFIDLYNSTILTHVRHAKSRIDLFIKKALTLQWIDLTNATVKKII